MHYLPTAEHARTLTTEQLRAHFLLRDLFQPGALVLRPVDLDRALRIKNNAMRGGVLEHIYMRDVQVGQVADAVLSVDLYYEEGQKGPYVPVIRDVEMRNVTSRKSKYAIYARAYEKSEISDVRVIDCRFDGVAQGSVTEGVRGLVLTGTTVNGRPASA